MTGNSTVSFLFPFVFCAFNVSFLSLMVCSEVKIPGNMVIISPSYLICEIRFLVAYIVCMCAGDSLCISLDARICRLFFRFSCKATAEARSERVYYAIIKGSGCPSFPVTVFHLKCRRCRESFCGP